MKVKVLNLDGSVAKGDVELSDAVFGVEPRADILHRVVTWQLENRRGIARATRERSEVARTGKKFGNQKGSGGARHGSRRSGIFVGGGKAFGPRPRSHEIGLPKKLRALGLRHALSSKVKASTLMIIDKAEFGEAKTKSLKAAFAKLGLENALIIDGAEVNTGFANAARNIPNIDVLPIQGINVYDILRRKTLVLTRAAVDALEARFK